MALGSSAGVSAVISAVGTLIAQHRLVRRRAELDYELHAKKRLNEAIGPLRFQLLLAVRDLLRRVPPHPTRSWPMDPSHYYAHSFLYRLLRPLAIVQLIERQMTFADFSVDASATDLIGYETAATRMLNGGAILLDHPAVDWDVQDQHIFRDIGWAAAGRLIVERDGQLPRVMTYGEFATDVEDPQADRVLKPIADLFAGCQESLTEKPILWLRLVGYTYVGAQLLAKYGPGRGIQFGEFPLEWLLEQSNDKVICSRVPEYAEAIKTAASDAL